MQHTNLPGNQCLGCGYDVFGQYATPTSTTQKLFELGVQDTDINLGLNTYSGYNANVANYIRLDCADMKTVHGETIETYLQNINVDLAVQGRYNSFSASARVNFSSSQFKNKSLQFTTVRHQIQKYLVRLGNISNLQLKQQFKADLNSPHKKAHQLFRQYGTHYLREYIVGGRLDYSCSTDTTKFKSTMSVQTLARMSYSALVGSIDVSSSYSCKTELERFNSNSKIFLNSVGGNPSEASKISNSPTAKQHFDAWFDSVNTTFVMCEFGNRSLVPIWNLCENVARKQQLIRQFPKYALQYSFDQDFQRPIEVHYTYDIKHCGSDQGSGAKFNCHYYKPNIGNNQYWFGHYAANSVVKMALPYIRVLDKNIIRAPDTFQMAWSDSGSKKPLNYSIWNPIAPPEYVALGCIFKFGVRDYEPPSGDEIKGLVCVHRSIASMGIAENSFVWSDQNTKSNKDVSVWPIVPKDKTGFKVQCFYASQKNRFNSPNPCFPTVFVLNISKIALGSTNNNETDKIIIKYAKNSIRSGGDNGLGANQNLSYFKPVLGAYQYWFGHRIIPMHTDHIAERLPCTTPLSNLTLRYPVGFEQVWNDSGSKKSLDYTCWRPIPPQGYVSLGYFLKFGANNGNPPSGAQIQRLVCVKQQLCIEGEAFRQPVWTDSGSKAKADLTLYDIIPKDNLGFKIGTFYAHRKSAVDPNPTNPQVWVLRTDKIKLE